MSAGFRVTVEDLATGETNAMIVAPGDYFLVTFDPAYLAGTQHYPKAGTAVATIKNHRPEWKARLDRDH